METIIVTKLFHSRLAKQLRLSLLLRCRPVLQNREREDGEVRCFRVFDAGVRRIAGTSLKLRSLQVQTH